MNFEEFGLGLGPDELAFYFTCESGVDADSLGNFLKRAATIARKNGAVLRVTAHHDGSLVVVTRVLRSVKGKVGKEFAASPIQSTAAATVLVAAVASGIQDATAPDSAEITPLAKAGWELVEKGQVESIQIVTAKTAVVIMDRKIASQISENVKEQTRSELVRVLSDEPPLFDQKKLKTVEIEEYRALLDDALNGELEGVAIYVGPDLHFRPKGHRYLVPVEYRENYAGAKLSPSKHYRIRGGIRFHQGMPGRLEVVSATPIG